MLIFFIFFTVSNFWLVKEKIISLDYYYFFPIRIVCLACCFDTFLTNEVHKIYSFFFYEGCIIFFCRNNSAFLSFAEIILHSSPFPTWRQIRTKQSYHENIFLEPTTHLNMILETSLSRIFCCLKPWMRYRFFFFSRM